MNLSFNKKNNKYKKNLTFSILSIIIILYYQVKILIAFWHVAKILILDFFIQHKKLYMWSKIEETFFFLDIKHTIIIQIVNFLPSWFMDTQIFILVIRQVRFIPLQHVR